MINPVKSISSYFEISPSQWGLRGDHALWDAFEKATVHSDIPSTAEELEILLYDLFKKLTGEEPEKGKIFYSQQYNNGGMSGGCICSDFWIETAFPLIIQRFIDSKKH
jgi:hypothetical protein